MNRVYNFSAGPSVLPLPVLEKAQKELLAYRESGQSVMEMSHRSKVYDDIIKAAEAKLRDVMNIPKNYHVMFMQGGASTQFAAIPLNLLPEDDKAYYLESGSFSSKSMKEASRFGNIICAGTSKDSNYSYVPKAVCGDDGAYLHLTTNNTIFGTCIQELPKVNMPIVADLSSNILGVEYDVSDFGYIYAGAQKNMGPAGLTVGIIRDDLVGNAREACPTMLNYKTMVDSNSMFNTPPTWSIYVMGLVLDWLKDMGGVKEIEKLNTKKANILYDIIDNSDFYKPVAKIEDRSIMNVTFALPSDDYTAKFVEAAGEKGLVNIKGHRSVGGIRASIYNAMPKEGVQTLGELMKEFERTI